MVLAELIGVFIVTISILYIYYKFVIFNFWRKRGIFYVEPIVPIGNITPLVTGKEQLGVFFQNVYMKYKDHRVFGMYSFFKPNLIIADLDLIRTVLTKEFESFHDRGLYYNEKIDPLTGNLVFTPGKRWRKMRAKMTPSFTSGKIKQMFPMVKECSEELVKYLSSKTYIEIKDVIARYTTDTIMSTAFGIKSNCIEEPNNEYRIYGKKTVEQEPLWFVLSFLAPQIMNFFSIPFTDYSVTSFYMNMFRQNVEYRQAYNVVRHDFMNLLMQFMEKGYIEADKDDKEATNESSTARKLTLTEATAQSFTFFVAGFETSATTITFALFELARNHDIQDKVRQEIDEMLAKYGDLTYDAVSEMTYLHKIVNESMRKYPPVSILKRICTKDIDLPTINIHLPKGTSVTIPTLGLQRDPSIYPEPDKFDPERFNADIVAKRHPYAFIPFGEGPRNCIGARFGYVQVKVGLANLLSKYKFSVHPRTQIPIIFDTHCDILTPKGGIYLTIDPR